jgi:hypothetical protein
MLRFFLSFVNFGAFFESNHLTHLLSRLSEPGIDFGLFNIYLGLVADCSNALQRGRNNMSEGRLHSFEDIS